MSSIKCFDVVSMVVDEASSQFGRIWKVNEYKYKILKQYCMVIDAMVKEFECEAIDVEVDDIKMTIAISIECPGIVVYEKDHQFYELLKRAISFGFYAVNKDAISAKIVFQGVWERV